MPRVAIATCADCPGPKGDDELLREALRGCGVAAETVAWDAAGVDWAGFDACLIRSTWDYHDKHEEFLGWTREVGDATQLWNPPELVAWNADKGYLRELGEAGVPIVPTEWVRRGEGARLDEILAARGWDEAVVKPVVDLGARNLRRVRRGDAGAQAALEEVLARHEAMVQPFLPSVEARGELSLVFIEGRFSHAVRKRPAKGDFRVQSTWGGSAAQEEPTAPELAIATAALEHLPDPPLYARADLIEDLNGHPSLIELELIEPNLYLSQHPASARTLAQAIAKRLGP